MRMKQWLFLEQNTPLKLKRFVQKDKVPNLNKKNFCSNCGTDLRYKRKIRDGVETLYDIENLSAVKKSGLDICVLNEESEGIEGIIIGKKLLRGENISGGL